MVTIEITTTMANKTIEKIAALFFFKRRHEYCKTFSEVAAMAFRSTLVVFSKGSNSEAGIWLTCSCFSLNAFSISHDSLLMREYEDARCHIKYLPQQSRRLTSPNT